MKYSWKKLFFLAKNRQLGFTFLEFLVVVAVIIFVIIFSFGYFNSTRIEARNSRRLADIDRLRTALNIYKDDELSYPVCGSRDPDPEELYGGSRECFRRINKHLKDKGYLKKNLSQDPLNEDGHYYYYVSNGSRAALIYKLEKLVGEEELEFKLL